jgi:hypothetical protein
MLIWLRLFRMRFQITFHIVVVIVVVVYSSPIKKKVSTHDAASNNYDFNSDCIDLFHRSHI